MSFPPTDWNEWSGRAEESSREDRYPLMRLVHFNPSAHLPEGDHESRGGGGENVGLVINVGSGELCMLTEWAPTTGEIVRIHARTPAPLTQTPTLAEVRWVRMLPPEFEGGGMPWASNSSFDRKGVGTRFRPFHPAPIISLRKAAI